MSLKFYKHINPTIRTKLLLDIFHQFKYNPNKVFVATDFFNSSKRDKERERYLGLLIKFGVIEEVIAVYYYGKKHNIKGECKGYRFIQRQRNDNLQSI